MCDLRFLLDRKGRGSVGCPQKKLQPGGWRAKRLGNKKHEPQILKGKERVGLTHRFLILPPTPPPLGGDTNRFRRAIDDASSYENAIVGDSRLHPKFRA